MKPYEFPKLDLKEQEDFHISPDDLLEGGYKRRLVYRLIEKALEDGAEQVG